MIDFRRFGLLAALCGALSGAALAQPASEAASGFSPKKAVHAARHMIVAAHPLAAQAGREVLRAGGNAVDAAIAAQWVLNVVEPQSSGLGGGGFLLYFDGKTGRLAAYDGRETAPASASPDLFLGADDKPLSFVQLMGSARAVGTPGLVRLMELVHARHGRITWPSLFEPAIRIAEEGFSISPRLAHLIAIDPLLRQVEAARALFFGADGRPKASGELLRNPELAATLRLIASQGPDAFYTGPVARDIEAAVRGHRIPGSLGTEDLAAYRAKERLVVCGDYRKHRICGMPPPSSGGIAVAALLGMLERFPMGKLKPLSHQAVHLFAEAGRLAYADRDYYIGDPQFVPQLLAQLLDRAYLYERSRQIRPERSLGRANPGVVVLERSERLGADRTSEVAGTTHLSVVDAEGNAVALTSSIGFAFGSRIPVRGFLLNDELIDFSFRPSASQAVPANGVQGGKRPRSSMAPTLAFDARGRLRYVLGSPGGGGIINFVALTLVALIDWRLGPQRAVDLPRYGSTNRGTELEKTREMEPLAATLAALGHDPRYSEQTSGVHIIEIGPKSLIGGADPRREGVALGD